MKYTALIPADGQWHALLNGPVTSIEASHDCFVNIDEFRSGWVRVRTGEKPALVEYETTEAADGIEGTQLE